MFSRRGILGLFSGLISWFAAKKVVAEPVAEFTQGVDHVLPEGFIVKPEWCPDGLIPMMGQNISKEQFPALFEVKQLSNGHRYIPPFHDLEIAPLPFKLPTVPTPLQSYGWVDNLTFMPRKEADTRVIVPVMSTKPLCATMAIEREKFEAFYGPIKESVKSPYDYEI